MDEIKKVEYEAKCRCT